MASLCIHETHKASLAAACFAKSPVLLLVMFVLRPNGVGGSSGSGSPSQLRQQLSFFGKLGLYFGAIRVAFLFFYGKDEQRAIGASKQ